MKKIVLKCLCVLVIAGGSFSAVGDVNANTISVNQSSVSKAVSNQGATNSTSFNKALVTFNPSIASGASSKSGCHSCTCIGSGSSSRQSDKNYQAFEGNMKQLETIVNNLLGKTNNNLAVGGCPSEPLTVIQAIDCQRLRVQSAFYEMSESNKNILERQKTILNSMALDKANYEVEKNIGKDKLKTACTGVASSVASNDVVKRSQKQYKNMSKKSSKLVAADHNEFAKLADVAEENSAAYLPDVNGRSQMLKKNAEKYALKNDFITPVKALEDAIEFNADGTYKDVVVSEDLKKKITADKVMPGADRNYYSTVLDRPVILDKEHKDATETAALMLINPVPENVENKISETKIDFIDGKTKQARNALASDITNFSRAFRSISLPEEGEKDSVTQGAAYIKAMLNQYGAEHSDIKNDISEYQFLDVMARRRVQSEGYYKLMANDSNTRLEQETIKSLATTLAIKWKQYQLLERILAVRSANLAANSDKK